MDWLSKVAEHHKLYIRYVKALGINTHAEDLVQQMYLRLHKYANEEKTITNGKVNKHYVWRVLYNICQSYRKDSKKFVMVPLDNYYNLVAEQPVTDKEEAYERIMQKMFREIDELDSKGYPYNKELFNLYAESAMSMRCISSVTDISLTSIFNTLKNCREQLSDELREDIEDFENEQYELIV